MKNIFLKFSNWLKKQIKRLTTFSKGITLPGLEGKSVYSVGKLFFKGLTEGYVMERASAVAFNFFTALFPMLLMLFTLIPYIPIENFQEDLLHYLQKIIPTEIWNILNGTIIYIITHKSGGLLSISFILSLFFGTNGINSLFNAFHQTYHFFTTTSSFLKQRWHALVILLCIIGIITVSISILGFGNRLIAYFMEFDHFGSRFIYYVFQTIRFLLSALGVVLAIALMYYFALPKERIFKLFSPGSILASLLIIITTSGFSYFISNFLQYNILYGSLGSILILTLYIFLNSVFILLGFEINTSISVAKNEKAIQTTHSNPTSENK